MAKSAVMPGEDVAVPEIFARFQWFEGLVKWRYYPSPLGALMDQRFNYEDEELAHLPTEGTWHFERSLPRIDEEIFEWIDVLECVEAARGRFTMVELGAGYGRWLLAGAMAARQRSLPFHLVGVEAEPRHFAWLKQHLRDNDIDPAAHTLIEAPVSGRRERVRFYVGDPKKWYGQSITTHMAPEVNGASIVEMDSITLADVLRPLGKVDLIDMDIQGAEHDVLANATDALCAQVCRLHIGTHGRDIEAELRKLFMRLGWQKLHDYECGSSADTAYGPVTFSDGVQSWLNPRLG